MTFDQQPIYLKNELVTLLPLQKSDFDRLFEVASDLLIWEQHPNPNRYQKTVFSAFFDKAMASNGAFIIIETATNEVIGSSRFYDFETKSVKIGYTFLGRKFWGNTYNKTIKSLMINHIFKTHEYVLFEIGAHNYRSQKAIEKIGALKIGEQKIENYGEDCNLNFIYQIKKTN